MKFNKDNQYYSFERSELVDVLPSIKGKVLEIGCGSGATLEYMKSKGASYVVGIDISQSAINQASDKGIIDLALVLDVEKDELPFQTKEFDCIILADVLEHLYDPWITLKKITGFLADDGYVLLSLPNIKYYKVLRRLIFHDEWSYANAGILDATHIRFFTLREITRLLAFANLQSIHIKRIFSSSRRMKTFNKLLLGKLDGFFTYQYYLLAQKKPK